jgi:hypothetical protein
MADPDLRGVVFAEGMFGGATWSRAASMNCSSFLAAGIN